MGTWIGGVLHSYTPALSWLRVGSGGARRCDGTLPAVPQRAPTNQPTARDQGAPRLRQPQHAPVCRHPAHERLQPTRRLAARSNPKAGGALTWSAPGAACARWPAPAGRRPAHPHAAAAPSASPGPACRGGMHVQRRRSAASPVSSQACARLAADREWLFSFPALHLGLGGASRYTVVCRHAAACTHLQVALHEISARRQAANVDCKVLQSR